MRTIYLATAYSYTSKLPFVGKFMMWLRCRRVTKVAALLMARGENVFSPITHSHYVAVLGKLPKLSHTFWLRLDKWYVDRCDLIYVLNQDGWKDSVGVQREIRWGLEQDKMVYLVDRSGSVLHRLMRYRNLDHLSKT